MTYKHIITQHQDPSKHVDPLTPARPGDFWAKVVDREMGGTTGAESHCHGSCPVWMAVVANLGKDSSSFSAMFPFPDKDITKFTSNLLNVFL